MKPFYKKGCALLLGLSLVTNLIPMRATAETRQTTEAETVYVGFIKDGERSTIFNQDWRFFKGNPSGAEKSDYNDSSWRALNLPHDWSIEGEFTVQGEAESGFLLGGTGWYRKHFVVPEKYEGKEFTLNFDGVYMNAEVYVNGKKLGEHNYGYTAFAFDISEALVCDGQTENIIAVKVSNPIPTSRWYSGSGIYRDVTLTVTDSIHVGHLGTTVTTPNIETQKGGNVDVDVKTVVENESEKEEVVTVKTTIVNKNGDEVSTPVTKEENIGSNSSITVKQNAIVNNPSLWSVDNPNMYKVKSEVLVGGKVVDTYFTDFGFRYYNLDRDTGFTLNGEMMKLQGVCMHHDQGSLGSASYYRAVERQMEIMKEMGVNAIRVSHNPASDMLLEICNRLGLLVINEAFDTWTNPKNGNINDFSKFFNAKIGENNQIINGHKDMSWGEFEARTMVKTSKNNPSIIMWSIGNEVLEGIGGDSSNYTTIAQNIINWFKDEDTTRPVTIGENRVKANNSTAIAIAEVVDNNGGIVGLNYANEGQFNTQRANHPDWTLYGSETSSAVHSRGYYKVRNKNSQSDADLQLPEFDNSSNKVGWGHSASDAWKYTIKNDYNAGEFVWTGFDYIGEPTPWNGVGTGSVGGGKGAAPKSSYFGIVDTAGFEKDVYYLYQSQWNDKVNTLHVLPTWNREDIAISNGQVQVDVFTDAYKVELYLNDKKVGEQTATEHKTNAGYKYYTFGNDALYPTFNVTYEEGTLYAKGFDKEGNEITNTKGRKSVTTSSTANTVKLSADNTTISSNGYDLSYITVDITDKNGNFVSGAANRLNFTLEGNGKIVGLDNGNAADIDSYKPTTDKSGSRRAFSGKALVIVQSTKDAGKITLNVSGDGLEAKSITINTENRSGDTKYLESYDIIKDYYVGLEEKPSLPSTVTGRYSDGTTGTFNIEWNEYDEAELSTPQIFKISGKLEGTEVSVVANIHVVGDVVSMENYSTFTYSGSNPTLPKTVKGYLANGSETEEFAVTWNLENVDFTTPDTNVIVSGTVELLGKNYPVTANVRVVPALKAARNLAINNSDNKDVPKLSQSCIRTADRLESINNGITNNSSDTQERWTNWNERSEVVNGEPKGAYVQLDWANKYDVDRLDLWLFTDNQSGRIPKKVEISYKNDNGEYVVAPHTNTTEVTYTAGETTYFLNDVINTDSIRIYMQQPTVGTCIGLAEVAVYEYVPKVNANTSNTLSEIKIDGKVLEGFDPSIAEYTINLEELPKLVEANSTENAAITLLPVYNNKSVIVVTSEDGNKNIYTVNYVLPQLKEYTVTVNTTEGGSIAGAGKYLEGHEAVLVATENEGYKFLGWYDEANNELSKEKTYRFTVNKDIKVNAKFEKLTEPEEPGDGDTEKVDKTVLGMVIEYAEEAKANGALENVVPAVVNEFEAALEEAKAVLGDKNATESQVDVATNRLINVIHMLEFKKGDKAELKKLVEIINALNENKYTPSTWSTLKVELEKANKVIADENAMEAEVAKAYEDLNKAFEGLELAADKSKLQSLVTELEAKDMSKYTVGTVNKFNVALSNAKSILDNKESTQEQINDAYNKLIRAYLELRLIPDKSKLEDLINKAESIDVSKYTEASVNKLNLQLAKVKTVLNNEEATQKEVDEAAKGLELALNSLEAKQDNTGNNNSGNNNNGNNNGGNNSSNNNNNGNIDTGKTNNKLPQTGDNISSTQIMILAVLLSVGGIVILRRKNIEL